MRLIRKGSALSIEIPDTGIAEFVVELARRHSVVYRRTGLSDMAKAITRMSGDEGASDHIEQLVIALRQAKVIDGQAMLEILGRYFDETRNV